MKKIAKGLYALIPIKSRTKSKKRKENVYYVEIKKIKLAPEQFKEEIDPVRGKTPLASAGHAQRLGRTSNGVKELAESIRKYGVIQPLTVVKVEKRKKQGISVYYKLLEGRKRLLAAKEAGLRVVPARIKNDQV